MRLALALVVLMTVMVSALATPMNLSEKEEWNLFKSKHGKRYTTEEEDSLRMKIYLDNKERVKRHNEKYSKGLSTFEVALNKFADLTSTEFRSMMNGFKGKKTLKGQLYVPPKDLQLPESVDWRTKGAVTGIKDQGSCGSCWAFSAVGSLEGQHFLKTGKLVSLSEQELVDCSGNEGNSGCSGGLMDNAFNYVKINKGIDTESSYPYEEWQGRCRSSKSSVGATCTGFVDIEQGNETALQAAVATVGPISVAIDASSHEFQTYFRGIYEPDDCKPNSLDHGVLVVGYGSENGEDYWMVKNSWGEDWGLDGYIKMARNKNNHCGIATMASYPLV